MYILEIREEADPMASRKTYSFSSKEEIVKFLDVSDFNNDSNNIKLYDIRYALLHYLVNGKDEELIYNVIHTITNLLHTTQEKTNV